MVKIITQNSTHSYKQMLILLNNKGKIAKLTICSHRSKLKKKRKKKKELCDKKKKELCDKKKIKDRTM